MKQRGRGGEALRHSHLAGAAVFHAHTCTHTHTHTGRHSCIPYVLRCPHRRASDRPLRPFSIDGGRARPHTGSAAHHHSHGGRTKEEKKPKEREKQRKGQKGGGERACRPAATEKPLGAMRRQNTKPKRERQTERSCRPPTQHTERRRGRP